MQVLPNIYEERAHNLEVYAQKRLFQNLTILNELPINQNESGEFTNYLASANPDEITGNPITTTEGVDFTEIDFGLPSETRGTTKPKGFVFRATDRVERLGRLDSTLQIFINKSVGRFVNYYDEVFLKAMMNGAGATAPADLVTVTDGFDVIENEYKLIDALEFQNGEDTGFTPTRVYANRKDVLDINIALGKADLKDESRVEYVPTTKIATGKMLVADMAAAPASIEKYTNPKYSLISSMETESSSGRVYTENGNPVPSSFINIKVSEPEEPERTNYFIWTEAGLNIVEPRALMYVQ